jgi:hypothetical protein
MDHLTRGPRIVQGPRLLPGRTRTWRRVVRDRWPLPPLRAWLLTGALMTVLGTVSWAFDLLGSGS